MSMFRVTSVKKSHEAHADNMKHVDFYVLLASPDFELAKQFMITLSGSSGTMGVTQIKNAQVLMEVVTPEHKIADLEMKMDQVDIIMTLVEHLDVLTINATRSLLSSITPLASRAEIVMVRMQQSGASQFKISCECGQKVYASIADIGRKGRCPTCKKSLTIPSPDSWLRDQKLAGDGMPILSAVIGHSTQCRTVLEQAIERVEARNRALHSSTVSIDLSANETRG